MKTNRFWIEIVALSVGIALALSLLLATLGAAAVAVGEQHESTPAPRSDNPPAQAGGSSGVRTRAYEGMVTCSRCGAKHSANFGRTATDCTRQCVYLGAAFALVDGDKSYQLEGDLNALKRAAGQRVRVMGTARGDTIRVSSIASVT